MVIIGMDVGSFPDKRPEMLLALLCLIAPWSSVLACWDVCEAPPPAAIPIASWMTNLHILDASYLPLGILRTPFSTHILLLDSSFLHLASKTRKLGVNMFQFEHLWDICYGTLFFCICWSSNLVHSQWILGFLFVFGGFIPKRVAFLCEDFIFQVLRLHISCFEIQKHIRGTWWAISNKPFTTSLFQTS